MVLFLYLTNIFDPIMEKEISNYSEKRHQKSLFTCSSSWFYFVLLDFQDTL